MGLWIAAAVVTIKRGAQGVATQSQASQGTPLIPLAQFDHDIFGNVVEQSRYANGTNSAGELGFEKPILSVQDEHRFTQYHSFGHALQNIDGEGKTIFYSYNAAGQVAKSWQLQTNADGTGHYVVKRYDYDGSGHQIATTEVLSDGTQVRTEVTRPALTDLLDEIRQMRDVRVPDKEFLDNKRSIVAGFARELESAPAVLGNHITRYRYGLPVDYWDKYPVRIIAVTQASGATGVVAWWSK